MREKPPSVAAAAPPAMTMPGFLRAQGRLRLRFGLAGGTTQRLELHESGGYRARLPTTFCPDAEAVLINTGGGMAGGDRLEVDLALDAGTRTVVTTQAAEKIYRAEIDRTCIATRILLGAGARLEWLPQETILFRGAKLTRALHVDLAADAAFLACEMLYFGRGAMGERLDSGLFRDRWRVRRSGKLIFAEDLRLEGDIHGQLARKAVADGAQALATLLIVQQDAENRLDLARKLLEEAAPGDGGCASGATALDGMLVLRFLGQDAARLRGTLARFLMAWRGRPLPRSWQS